MTAADEPKPAVEQTDQGDQLLIGDVRPVTDRDRLAVRAARPLGASEPQRPMDIGLFGDDAHQADLIDYLGKGTKQ